MDRVSIRQLAPAIRLIREPVVVTYSYPRSHPLYGAGEECGVYVPMSFWNDLPADIRSRAEPISSIKLPDIEDDLVHLGVKP
jgi:hypothetical protein